MQANLIHAPSVTPSLSPSYNIHSSVFLTPFTPSSIISNTNIIPSDFSFSSTFNYVSQSASTSIINTPHSHLVHTALPTISSVHTLAKLADILMPNTELPNFNPKNFDLWFREVRAEMGGSASLGLKLQQGGGG